MLPFTKQEKHILGNSNTMGPSARLPVEKAEKNAKRVEHLLIYSSGLNKFLRISFCSSGGVHLHHTHLISKVTMFVMISH